MSFPPDISSLSFWSIKLSGRCVGVVRMEERSSLKFGDPEFGVQQLGCRLKIVAQRAFGLLALTANSTWYRKT